MLYEGQVNFAVNKPHLPAEFAVGYGILSPTFSASWLFIFLC